VRPHLARILTRTKIQAHGYKASDRTRAQIESNGEREKAKRDRTARKNEDETKTKEETVAAKDAFLFGVVCWQEAIRCLFLSKPVAQ